MLSGFVIANVGATKEATFTVYAAARLARLWSVLMPALLLGPLFDMVGMQFDRSHYQTWAPNGISGHFLEQTVASATFLHEVWFVSLAPQFNTPVWSIGFEAWYYAFFAIFMFANRRKAVWLLLAAICAGPKILLLFPTWVMGCFLYHWRDKIPSHQPLGWLLFILGPAFVVFGHAIQGLDRLRSLYLPLLGHDFVYDNLGMARDFLWQNLVGIAISAHLAGAFILAKKLPEVRGRFAATIRVGAGLTYSIYLLHFPAQLMISAMCHSVPVGLLKIAIVLVGSLVISAGLGVVLEPLKIPIRRAFLSFLGPRCVPAGHSPT